VRHDFGEEGLLDGEVFGDSFDDPVTVFQTGEVIFKIARDYEARICGVVKRCGFGLEQGGDGAGGDAASGFRIGIVGRDDVEQEHGHSGVGQMRSDARAHGSGSENGGAAQERSGGMALGFCGYGGAHVFGSPGDEDARRFLGCSGGSIRGQDTEWRGEGSSGGCFGCGRAHTEDRFHLLSAPAISSAGRLRRYSEAFYGKNSSHKR
jgi:hypothetical protein